MWDPRKASTLLFQRLSWLSIGSLSPLDSSIHCLCRFRISLRSPISTDHSSSIHSIFITLQARIIDKQDDYSDPLLFLREGRIPSLQHSRSTGLTTRTQVTGDLWERYLKLIDGGIGDGFVVLDDSQPKHKTYTFL